MLAKVLAQKPHHHDHHHEHGHHHNCFTCHHEHEKEEQNQTRSLITEIHKHNGHACIDPHCDIEAPHAHNRVVNSKFNFKPLELIISESKLPQWLKELVLNTSFLTPAMLINELLQHTPMPKFLKSWLAIGAMHGINRGPHKLGRLGLTCGISALSSAVDNSRLPRFIATTLVAIIEKFSGHEDHHDHSHCSHHHEPEQTKGSWQELETIAKNLFNAKQWKELLPSLINIEAKVNILAPLTKKLLHALGLKRNLLNTLLESFFVSAGFVAFDNLLRRVATVFGKTSMFASTIGSLCACCGSPVCAAAATDSAMNNTLV